MTSLNSEQIQALRVVLLKAMSAESEDRWSAGWMMNLERILWIEGGHWEVVGLCGWPLGMDGEDGWLTWEEAGAAFAHES